MLFLICFILGCLTVLLWKIYSVLLDVKYFLGAIDSEMIDFIYKGDK